MAVLFRFTQSGDALEKSKQPSGKISELVFSGWFVGFVCFFGWLVCFVIGGFGWLLFGVCLFLCFVFSKQAYDIHSFPSFVAVDGWFVRTESKNSLLGKQCLGHTLYLSTFFSSFSASEFPRLRLL